MADLNRKMAEGHTVSDLDTVIDEVYGAHGDYDTLGDRLDDIDTIIDTAKLGIHYKGEVNYYSNLPTTGVSIGDAYTVKYAGSSGTTPDGTEYVWGTVSGTNQWINFSKDSYTKAEVDALLALKQNALTTAQLSAVNSGIDSTKVEQIETNKNNISWLVDTGVKNLLDYGRIKTINPLFTWSGNTGTYNGVTIKIESNAIKISASNTSASVYIYVSSGTDTWKNGNTYRLMGVPQASVDNVDLNIQSGSPDYYTYYTKISNQEVTFPNVNTRIRLSIASGATFSEVTIPLMMCSVAAYSASSTYQPYAMSNVELTAKEQVNENNILSLTANAAITSIISDVTTATGFTLEAQSFLYKQGKHIFGRLIISSTNAYTTSDVEPCTIGTYKPSLHYVAFCGLGADKWKIKSIGYAYISSSSGAFKVNDSGDNSNYTANIPIDYVTA